MKCTQGDTKLIDAAPELLQAMQAVIYDLRDWARYNYNQVESFEGNEADMQRDIANAIQERLKHAMAVIKKATE